MGGPPKVYVIGVQSSEFRIWGSGFGVQGLGFRVWGSGIVVLGLDGFGDGRPGLEVGVSTSLKP